MVDRLAMSEANKSRIEAVENGFGMSGTKLLIPGRVLVGEGVLTKTCRKKPKPRQFFLFNDIMVYGNILINKKKYNKQHIIPLEGVTLEDLEDDDRNHVNKNGWLIKTPHKSFRVYAATHQEKVEWMAHINKCIQDLIARTGRSPSAAHAAVWIPDTDTKKCMHCQKTQFTILNRRHHCRNCGKVICGDCSKNKFLIPSQSKSPVRVCNTCFDELSHTRTSYNLPKASVDVPVVETETEPKTNGDVAKPTEAEVVEPEHPSNDSKEYLTGESSDDDDGANGNDTQAEKDLAEAVEELNIYSKPNFYENDLYENLPNSANTTVDSISETNEGKQDTKSQKSDKEVSGENVAPPMPSTEPPVSEPIVSQ